MHNEIASHGHALEALGVSWNIPAGRALSPASVCLCLELRGGWWLPSSQWAVPGLAVMRKESAGL